MSFREPLRHLKDGGEAFAQRGTKLMAGTSLGCHGEMDRER